jgi:hypothetical protein
VPDLETLLPPFVRKKDLDFAERTVARALRLLLAGRFGRTVGAEDGFDGLGDDGQGGDALEGFAVGVYGEDPMPDRQAVPGT